MNSTKQILESRKLFQNTR